MAEAGTLRARLLARLFLPMLGLLLVSGAIAYYAAFRFANQVYDHWISDTAVALSQLARTGGEGVVADLPPEALHMLASDQRDRLFHSITTPEGRLVAGHPGLTPPATGPEAGAPPACRDATLEGEPIRVAAYRPRGLPVVVQVAETVGKRDTLALEIIASMLLPLLFLVLLGAALVWVGVAQGLQPLTRLAEQLSRRQPSDLGPLAETTAPGEVQPLVRALNGLLARVDAVLSAQQRFVADAAHQLRTPIAGLKTQAEMAQRATDPASLRHILDNIVAASSRMSSLVAQLLLLARTHSASTAPISRQRLALDQLARTVTADWIARSIERRMDLGFEADDVPRHIHGDPVLLREMLGNLIDNALKHCEPGTVVTVSVHGQDGAVVLAVSDSGPGIPSDERPRVFERFYRLPDSTVPGTGLGLSIVQDVARLHEAAVEIGTGPDGRGTRIAVQFPAR